VAVIPKIQVDNFISGLEITQSQFPALHALKYTIQNDLAYDIRKVVAEKELEKFLQVLFDELKTNSALANRDVLSDTGFTLWIDNTKVVRLLKSDLLHRNVGSSKSDVMATYPRAFTIANYGKREINFQRYRFNSKHGVTVFDKNCKLRLVANEKIEPREVITFREPNEIIEFEQIEVNRPTLLFVENLRDTKSLTWLFDRKSKTSVKAISANSNASKTEVLLALFSEANFEAAYPAVQDIIENNEHHFVRWTAVKCLLRINPEEGISAVKDAVNDTHPHVRNSAVKALKIFKEQGFIK